MNPRIREFVGSLVFGVWFFATIALAVLAAFSFNVLANGTWHPVAGALMAIGALISMAALTVSDL